MSGRNKMYTNTNDKEQSKRSAYPQSGQHGGRLLALPESVSPTTGSGVLVLVRCHLGSKSHV